MNDRSSRIEQRLEMHRALVENTGKSFVSNKVSYLPILMAAIVMVAGLGIAMLNNRRGNSDISKITNGDVPFVIYNDKIYIEYSGLTFGKITEENTESMLGFASGEYYNMCEVYSLKEYPKEEWIAVLYEGQFRLLHAEDES
ncbi:MAG: hypothetical protein LBM16_05590 [Clostridiales bacterium]|jgi:hypothetical protein|nr:hypothetical protein [Clostridiales bacterium]